MKSSLDARVRDALLDQEKNQELYHLDLKAPYIQPCLPDFQKVAARSRVLR